MTDVKVTRRAVGVNEKGVKKWEKHAPVGVRADAGGLRPPKKLESL